jgi:hypothetical protein
MPSSLFLSYVYEDLRWAEEITSWARSGYFGDAAVTSETRDLRQFGEREIESHLKPKIRGAACVLCLIGKDTHNHGWVRYELQVAASLNKRVVLIRIPNTTGLAPDGFRHLPVIHLDPHTIAEEIKF